MSRLLDQFSRLSKEHVELQSQHEQLKEDIDLERMKQNAAGVKVCMIRICMYKQLIMEVCICYVCLVLS